MNFSMPVLSRPPRNVPLTTKLAVLGGGVFTTFGWFFLAFGLLFTWVFAGNADWSSLSFHGQLENATGYITGSDKTHFSVGGSKHSDGTPIYAYHYKFYFNGADYAGTSYRTGERTSSDEVVPVEFPAGHPEKSRIRGMLRAPMSLGVALLVFIFPLVGLGIVIPSTLIGRKNLRLLANGELAQGRIVNKEATNESVNHCTVYKFTLEFTDVSGQVQHAVVKTEEVEKLEGKPFERLFYNPQDPAHCVALDCLAGKQGFDENGELLPNSKSKAIGVLCLPAISVLVMLGGVWWTFLKK